MAIDTFDHIYVETKSFDKTLEFWKELGFEVQNQWGDDGHRACQLSSQQAAVVLAECAALSGAGLRQTHSQN